ncbi:hypothetical protein HG536_0D00510 [Torulaspora globosa]|uniref:Uncharacterized protein n=1 Tax=Torulaspora globosa TaxID=48254 RepID=A0A7G3ZG93_9SACH|nr:uncharacterized protein HG536_0D00510 [Torulaspora globosa]QLL32529.1 hypothetical protein HG536_0D00510 [Torulaspora globosa]
MNNKDLELIKWPEERNINNYVAKNPTASIIQGLFTNAGIIGSIIYIMIRQVIVPCLDSHYLQRVSLSASTLLQLRRAVTLLQGKLKYTPVSALGFNESDGRVERSTQTLNESCDRAQERESRWKRFNDKLKEADNQLQLFNSNSSSSKNMDSFHLQVKLLVDGIKLDESREKTRECCERIIRSIREAKGWLVNGRSPRLANAC